MAKRKRITKKEFMVFSAIRSMRKMDRELRNLLREDKIVEVQPIGVELAATQKHSASGA